MNINILSILPVPIINAVTSFHGSQKGFDKHNPTMSSPYVWVAYTGKYVQPPMAIYKMTNMH